MVLIRVSARRFRSSFRGRILGDIVLILSMLLSSHVTATYTYSLLINHSFFTDLIQMASDWDREILLVTINGYQKSTSVTSRLSRQMGVSFTLMLEYWLQPVLCWLRSLAHVNVGATP